MIVRAAGQAFAMPVDADRRTPSRSSPATSTGRGATPPCRVRDQRVPLIVVREALGILGDRTGFVS